MKVAILFPGYGSQFIGMGKELYDKSRIMQEYFEEAANCVDINFVKLCFASSDIDIARMGNAYLSLFVVSSSLFALLADEGIQGDVMAGYGVGQFAALHAVGSMSLPDSLYLLNKYVSLYQELLDQYSFAFAKIVGIDSPALKMLCKEKSSAKSIATIVSYDLPEQHIIAGHMEAVDAVCATVIDREGIMETVEPAVGLHSLLAQPIAQSFKMYLEKVDFKDAEVPLVCNTTSDEVRIGKELSNCVEQWITEPIVWSQVMEKVSAYDLLIEIGPGTHLRDMIKNRYPDAQIISINKRSDIEQLKKVLVHNKEALEK